ncbi:cytochrome c oxidase subunit 1 [Aphanomyces cochlioides]|nr:cytochrome c oxidase subunit 1 [Aphanomyces cochlioides]
MADRFEILEETSHTPEKVQPKNEDEELNELVEELTIEKKDVKLASQAKEEGNELFKAGRYLDAHDLYSKALRLCPTDDEYAYNKAVYYNNRAACLIHLGRPDEAIEDCTQSITLSPTYVKAYMRRSQAYEKIDKLEEALQDVKKVLEIDPKIPAAIDAEKRLSVQVKEQQEKMKAEMLDKLKGFGNTILGKFGLSTDNFKMVQDPATGSYSINFSQNPTKP